MKSKKINQNVLLPLAVMLAGTTLFFGWKYFAPQFGKEVTLTHVVGKRCVESDGYCHIPEWGIKFKTQVKDPIYSIRQESAEEFDAGLSTIAASRNEDCDPKHDAALGFLKRFEKDAILPIPSDTEFRAGTKAAEQFVTKVGSFYYLYSKPQDNCYGADYKPEYAKNLLPDGFDVKVEAE